MPKEKKELNIGRPKKFMDKGLHIGLAVNIGFAINNADEIGFKSMAMALRRQMRVVLATLSVKNRVDIFDRLGWDNK